MVVNERSGLGPVAVGEQEFMPCILLIKISPDDLSIQLGKDCVWMR